MEKFFNELLESRERRFNLQIELIRKFNRPIISFMINVPGMEKRNDMLVKFHKDGIELIRTIFKDKILDELYVNEHTGMYYLASIDMAAEDIKKAAVEIENSKAGRLFDVDVFSEDERQLSRTELGLAQRKCLSCDGIAKICIKERKHSYQELIAKMNELIISNEVCCK